MAERPVERLIQANPHTEVWWDSSPRAYKHWETRMLGEAPPQRRYALRDQLRCHGLLHREPDPGGGAGGQAECR